MSAQSTRQSTRKADSKTSAAAKAITRRREPKALKLPEHTPEQRTMLAAYERGRAGDDFAAPVYKLIPKGNEAILAESGSFTIEDLAKAALGVRKAERTVETANRKVGAGLGVDGALWALAAWAVGHAEKVRSNSVTAASVFDVEIDKIRESLLAEGLVQKGKGGKGRLPTSWQPIVSTIKAALERGHVLPGSKHEVIRPKIRKVENGGTVRKLVEPEKEPVVVTSTSAYRRVWAQHPGNPEADVGGKRALAKAWKRLDTPEAQRKAASLELESAAESADSDAGTLPALPAPYEILLTDLRRYFIEHARDGRAEKLLLAIRSLMAGEKEHKTA